MTRSTVRELVYIDLDYLKLPDCITALNKAFSRVPEDCRADAYFFVEHGEEYGSSYIRQNICYSRPETDDEMAKRVKLEEHWEASRIAAAKRLLGLE